MPIFKSRHPPINLPTDVTIWDWLFAPATGAVAAPRPHSEPQAGYTDASTGARLSYNDVAQHSTHICTALVQRYGLQPGDTLALFSANSIWYPVMMFAGVRAGAKVSGASPAYSVAEMAYALRTAGAKFLATSPGSLNVALAAAKEAGVPKEHIFMLEGGEEERRGFVGVRELIEMGRRAEVQAESYRLPAGKRNGDVCAFLSFSSGTTGLPKAGHCGMPWWVHGREDDNGQLTGDEHWQVMISHQNVIAQSLQVQQLTPATHKKVLAVLPLFHITGLVHGMHLPVLLNAEVIMLPSFTMPSMLQTVQDYRIEELLLVPPIIIRLVRDPVVDKYDLRCVKRFSSGAAPLSDEILLQLQAKFPWTGFKQGYGMTESCSCITAHPPTHYDYKYAHKVGTVVASTEVKLIKEDGSEAGIGEPGEILGRGPQIVMGYYNNDKATRETFDDDGWLHTGDQGVMDDEGFITITDRIKEMIKVKGIGVAPAELEDLLLGHPKVEDAAVVAMQDDYSGELPKAYVVLKAGTQASEAVGQELLQYVLENKVRHKRVKEVEFIEEIPKSASGKILRKVLRQRQKEGGSAGIVIRLPTAERARL